MDLNKFENKNNKKKLQLELHLQNMQLIGNKKGRPMIDKDIIYDEINQKFYDPEIDFNEYKKARK
jgi:hypothetical protein